MIVTITSKGQITIPKQLRQKFHLKTGDKLDFDEFAPMLMARRAVDQSAWTDALQDWKKSAKQNLQNHPWENQRADQIIDDLRGGPAETNPSDQ